MTSKYQFQPFLPPTPFICSIPYASIPANFTTAWTLDTIEVPNHLPPKAPAKAAPPKKIATLQLRSFLQTRFGMVFPGVKMLYLR